MGRRIAFDTQRQSTFARRVLDGLQQLEIILKILDRRHEHTQDAVARLDGCPGILVDGGPIADAAASTVAEITGPELKVLRPGPVTECELRAALRG